MSYGSTCTALEHDQTGCHVYKYKVGTGSTQVRGTGTCSRLAGRVTKMTPARCARGGAWGIFSRRISWSANER
jgi:hypothetical protein